jgi:hypothetical protein
MVLSSPFALASLIAALKLDTFQAAHVNSAAWLRCQSPRTSMRAGTAGPTMRPAASPGPALPVGVGEAIAGWGHGNPSVGA